jgi:transcriptional regulator with XRE-family HTH domain
MSKFGERLRKLRQAKKLSQKQLAARVGINYTYLSKCESEKLDFAPYPGEDLIRRLAVALDADEDELLFLAKKIPADIRERVLARPDAFRTLAALDDEALDEVIRQVAQRKPTRGTPKGRGATAAAGARG